MGITPSELLAEEARKFPKGYGRLSRYMERLERCQRAYLWLAFRFDLAAMDREQRALDTQRQLAETGGVDPSLHPKPSEIAYLKFGDL